ncbi:hypothetical protein QW131_03585 [Roseibium salinum]|nr:hypothetical protein [Roseibium salinum]
MAASTEKLSGRHARLPGQPVIVAADRAGGLAGIVENAERQIVFFHGPLCVHIHTESQVADPQEELAQITKSH